MQLVGAERERLVGSLVDDYAWVVEHQRPRLVSLEAPLGWGKTRIVQSLYERLAAEQPSPAYWPRWLADPDATDPLQTRKRIVPDRFDPHAEMPWMWWGLSCQLSREGVPAHALSEYGWQLDRHLEGVVKAHSDNAQLRQQLLELAKSIAGLAPGAGQVVGLIDTGAQAYQVLRLGHAALRRGSEGGGEVDRQLVPAVDPGQAPMIERVLELLRLVANRRLPVVMVVEDAHDADVSLVTLLDQLFAGAVPVAVLGVLTSWPERLEEQQRRDTGLGAWLDRAASQAWRSCRRERLEPLPTRDLQRLVERRAPGTELAVAAALAERADGNPFVLQGLLVAPTVQMATVGDRIDLPVEKVAVLANAQEDLMRQRWDTMPREVKEAMCLSSLQGREAVQELVRLAQQVVTPRSATRVDQALERAADPCGWIRRVGELLRFAEQYTLEIACEMQKLYFDAEQAAEGRRSIAERIAGWRRDGAAWSTLSPEVRGALVGTHVEIARAGQVQDPGAAAASAHEAAVVALDRGAYRAALRLARDGSAWAGQAEPGDAALGIACRLQEARALLALGDQAGGRRLLEQVLAAAEAALGARHQHTLVARTNLARLLLELGDWRRAREMLEQLVADSEQVLGPDHDNTLDARTHLAIATISAGDLEEGRGLLQELLPVREAASGPGHPDTIELRVLLAELAMLDEPERARELQAEALKAAEAVLPPDHPHVLAGRSTLALTLRQLGYYREARELQEDTLADYQRVLGERHEKALVERVNLAQTLLLAGDPRASVMLQEAARRLEETLGPEHPQALAARRVVAESAARLGDLKSARLLLEELLDAHERALGRTHPLTGGARRTLAGVLLQLDDGVDPELSPDRIGELLRRARALLELELEERRRVLGPLHRVTLEAATDLAFALFRLGDGEAAAELLHREVAEREQAFGPASPGMLTARAAIADTLFALGAYEEAGGVYQEVAEQREAALGPEHPDTVAARIRFGEALRALGRSDSALAVLVDCYALLRRTHGPNHPRTVSVLADVADLAFGLEEHEQARTAYEQLIACREQVLGPDHLDTLWATFGLSETLEQVGDRVVSRRLLDQVIRDYRQVTERAERELPPQHPFTATAKANLAALLERRGKPRRARAEAPMVGGRIRVPQPRSWYVEEELTLRAPDRRAEARIESRFVPPGVLSGRLARWRDTGMTWLVCGLLGAGWAVAARHLPVAGAVALAVVVALLAAWLAPRLVPLVLGTGVTSRRYAEAEGRERSRLPDYRELAFGREALVGPRRGYLRRFQWQTASGASVVQTERYRVRGWTAFKLTTAVLADHAEERDRQLEQVVESVRLERAGRLDQTAAPLLRLLGRRHARGTLRARLPSGWRPTEQLKVASTAGKGNLIVTLEAVDPGLDAEQYATLLEEELPRLPGFRPLGFGPAEVFGGRQGFRRAYAWEPEADPPVPIVQWQAYHAEAGRGVTATATCRLQDQRALERPLRQLLDGIILVD